MKNSILSWIAYLFFRFWNFFLRIKTDVSPGFQQLLDNHDQFIMCGWHNNIVTFVAPFSQFIIKKHKYKSSAMVSLSKDGELINLVLQKFGIESVRGSSSRGGAAAFRQILKNLKTGRIPVFSPDGPRGPRYKVKPGTIQAASLSGLPLVLFCTMPQNYYDFPKSWDHHRIAKFGSKVIVQYSEPFFVPKLKNEDDIAKYCKILENKMMDQEENLKKMILLF